MVRCRSYCHQAHIFLVLLVLNIGYQDALGSGIIIADFLDPHDEPDMEKVIPPRESEQVDRSRELLMNDKVNENQIHSDKLEERPNSEYGRPCDVRTRKGGGCDTTRGFLCTFSSNPSLRIQSRNRNRKLTGKGSGYYDKDELISGPVCDCAPKFFYDPQSQECRRRLGDACKPNEEGTDNNPESVFDYEYDLETRIWVKRWYGKCPVNAECSTNVGRYGPRGAKGLCRCQPGFVISSTWYAEGGGAVCEREGMISIGTEAEGQIDNNKDYSNFVAPAFM